MGSLHSEALRFLRRGPVAVWPVVLEAGSAKPISVRHDVRCDGAVGLGNRSPVWRRGTLKMPRHAALGRTTAVPGRRVRCRAAYCDCRRGQSDCYLYLAKHHVNQTRRPELGLRSSVGKPLCAVRAACTFFSGWGPLAKDVRPCATIPASAFATNVATARRQFLRPDEVRRFLRLAVSPECSGAGRVPTDGVQRRRARTRKRLYEGHHGRAFKRDAS
jgi:hypothetical protein